MGSPQRPWKLREAARCFRGGGVFAYPTEAVYGLGCDPLDPGAVGRILTLKRRPMDKGLILIAADFQQLRPFLGEIDPRVLTAVLASWPGPNTWLLPAAADLPVWIRGHHSTVAVRVTAHPLAAALCRACGSPLVSTSANPGTFPPARSALGVRRYFDEDVDLILSGRLGGLDRPTSIRNASDMVLVRP